MIVATAQGLNYNLLRKGDYVDPAVIEIITGEIAETPGYQLAAMNLKTEIEGALQSQRRPMTLKHEGYGIRLLTDTEAAEYNKEQGEAGVRKLNRAFKRNQVVEEVNLSDPERQSHYRTLEVQGKQLQAIRKVRRELHIAPVKRRTPGLRVAETPAAK